MRQAELLSGLFFQRKIPHVCMCAHRPDTSWQKRLISGKTFLLSHLREKEKKKKEAHSFSLWLKKNISAGQGLIVTTHFKILLDCLSPFISLVIQLRVGKVLWPIEWPIHHTYWPLCPGGLGPPNLGCWLHLWVHCLAPQLPRYNPMLWYRLKERNETTMSACPWSEHACTR